MSDSQNPVETYRLTLDQWQQAKALVQEKLGLALTEDGGRHESAAKGITFDYTVARNETAGTVVLTLQVEKRSWYDPSVDTIDQDVTQAIQQIGGVAV